MPDPSTIRAAIEKAMKPPSEAGAGAATGGVAPPTSATGSNPLGRPSPQVPETDVMQIMEQLTNASGGAPLTKEQLQEYRDAYQAEPKKILRSESTSMMSRIGNAFANTFTAKTLRGVWHAFDSTDDIFYTAVRPATMMGAFPGTNGAASI